MNPSRIDSNQIYHANDWINDNERQYKVVIVGNFRFSPAMSILEIGMSH